MLGATHPSLLQTVMKIRECTLQDVSTIATLVSVSNKSVAVRFGLTEENCPKHSSFYTEDRARADFARGEIYFLIEDGSIPLGCVAYENPSPGLAYLNRLCVLPEYRNRGIGARLVERIIKYAHSASIRTISIGVIGEHTELQLWYNKLGFIDGESKRFPHLPFSVKYMTYPLQKS